jgi:opacity protein-like surface antigen
MKNKVRKKANLLLSTLAGVLIFSAPTVYSQESFFDPLCLPYLRLDSGQAHFAKVQGSNITGEKINLKSTSNLIIGVGVGLGINFGDKFRSDIVWFHHLDPVLEMSNNTDVVKRKPRIDAYFANLYYEGITNLNIFNPYIGAGIGFAKIKDRLDISSINNNQLSRQVYTIKGRNNFAYRLAVGSTFDLNEKMIFDLSYNYHDYGRTKSQLDNTQKQIGKNHYRSHIISCGLRIGI